MLCLWFLGCGASLSVSAVCRRLAGREGGGQAFQECEAEHACEGALLEDLGRLLGDVRASARFPPHLLKHV